MVDYSVTEIEAKGKFLDFKLKEILKYRDLIWLFVKRNYSTRYKQTILGSSWLIINPLCTVIMNTIVFGAIAGLSTDGIPKPLFYLAGNIVWTLFSGCLNDSAGTFTSNAGIFGKIYFPRLCTPIANAITQIGDFFIKFGLLMVIGIIYLASGGFDIEFRLEMLLLPIVLLQLAIMGVGCGIIISSFTTKYRDLQVLVGFGLSIWMYLSPIVYSLEEIPAKYLHLYLLNPIAPAILIFKKAVLGSGFIPWDFWGYSLIFMTVIIFLGVVIFNHVERTFMDTV